MRQIRAKRAAVSRSEEIRFLLLLTAGLCVTALGTLIAIFSTAKVDISALTPVLPRMGDYVILNWAELERDRPKALRQGAAVFTGARVQALGYMMESERPIRTGELVREFVLLPDAGNLLHPAHRFGDQMLAVHLRVGEEIEFVPRNPVWAKGILRASSGDPAGSRPLYDLDEAVVFPASKMDIQHYFR